MTRIDLSEPLDTSEDPREILAALTLRADAEAVAVLRSLTAVASAEIATEAARALGELWTRFDADLERFRKELGAQTSGVPLVCPRLIDALAAEARELFEQANDLVPERGDEITARWACLEIVTEHPKAALTLLDRALAQGCEEPARHEFMALQEKAWFAFGDVSVDGNPR